MADINQPNPMDNDFIGVDVEVIAIIARIHKITIEEFNSIVAKKVAAASYKGAAKEFLLKLRAEIIQYIGSKSIFVKTLQDKYDLEEMRYVNEDDFVRFAKEDVIIGQLKDQFFYMLEFYKDLNFEEAFETALNPSSWEHKSNAFKSRLLTTIRARALELGMANVVNRIDKEIDSRFSS